MCIIKLSFYPCNPDGASQHQVATSILNHIRLELSKIDFSGMSPCSHSDLCCLWQPYDSVDLESHFKPDKILCMVFQASVMRETGMSRTLVLHVHNVSIGTKFLLNKT